MESIEGIFEFAGFLLPPKSAGVPFWCQLAVFYELPDARTIASKAAHEDELRAFATGTQPSRVHVFIVPRSDAVTQTRAYGLLSPFLRYSALRFWRGYDGNCMDGIVQTFQSLSDDAIKRSVESDIMQQNERVDLLMRALNGGGVDEATGDTPARDAALNVEVKGFLCMADVRDALSRLNVTTPYARSIANAISASNAIKWEPESIRVFARIVHIVATLELQTACLRSVLLRTPVSVYACDVHSTYHWLSDRLAQAGHVVRALSTDDAMDVDADPSAYPLPAADSGHTAYFTRLGRPLTDAVLFKQATRHYLTMRGIPASSSSPAYVHVQLSPDEKAVLRYHMSAYTVPGADYEATNADVLMLVRARRHLEKLMPPEEIEPSDAIDALRFCTLNILQQEFGIFLSAVHVQSKQRASPAALEKSRFMRWHQVIELVPTCLDALAVKVGQSTKFDKLLHPFVHSQMLLQSPYQQDAAFYPVPYFVWDMKIALKESRGHGAAMTPETGKRAGDAALDFDWTRRLVRLRPPSHANRAWDARWFGHSFSLRFLASLFRTGKVCLVDPDPDMWLRVVHDDIERAYSVSIGMADVDMIARFLGDLATARHGYVLSVVSRATLTRVIDIAYLSRDIADLNLVHFRSTTASLGETAVQLVKQPRSAKVALSSAALFEVAEGELKPLLRQITQEHWLSTSAGVDLLATTSARAVASDAMQVDDGDEVDQYALEPSADTVPTVATCRAALEAHAVINNAGADFDSKFFSPGTAQNVARLFFIDTRNGAALLEAIYGLVNRARELHAHNQHQQRAAPIQVQCIFYPFASHRTYLSGRLAVALLSMHSRPLRPAVGTAATSAYLHMATRVPFIPAAPMQRTLGEALLQCRLQASVARSIGDAACDLLATLGCRYKLITKPPVLVQPAAPVCLCASTTPPLQQLCLSSLDARKLEYKAVNLGRVLPMARDPIAGSDSSSTVSRLPPPTVMQHLHHVMPTTVELASLRASLASAKGGRTATYFGHTHESMQALVLNSTTYTTRHVFVLDLTDRASLATMASRANEHVQSWYMTLAECAWSLISGFERLVQGWGDVLESDVEVWIVIDAVTSDNLGRYDADAQNASGRSALSLLATAIQLQM